MPPLGVLVLLAAGSAAVGALGGIGGAVLLVPVLVLLGVDPLVAAPLGLLSVAAGSLAAGPAQLRTGLVHHRLGVTIEVFAGTGVILGAILADALPGDVLTRFLGVVAIAAAVAGIRSAQMRNRPEVAFSHERSGEWPGTLGGAYRLGDEVVPYHAQRLPLGLATMIGAGFVAGLSGTGGGFIKTPAMRELMRIPVKVAAATSTFTVGLSASVGLIVFWRQGRVDVLAGAAVVVGGLIGGAAGAAVQERLSALTSRRVVSALLAVVGLALVVRG